MKREYKWTQNREPSLVRLNLLVGNAQNVEVRQCMILWRFTTDASDAGGIKRGIPTVNFKD